MTKIMLKLEQQLTNDFFEQIKDLKTYGLFKYICSHNYGEIIDTEELSTKFNLSFTQIKELLDRLQTNNIITLKLINDNNIIISIALNNTKEEEKTNEILNKFEIPVLDFNNIIALVSTPNFNMHLFKQHLQTYVTTNTNSLNKYVIEDEQSYRNFIYDVRAQDYITYSTGIKLTNTQFDFLFSMFYEYNFAKELVNLAIDYTITTSVYKSFNVKFATVIMHNWSQNNIYTYEDALSYIKENKEIIINNASKEHYVEPVYDQTFNVESEVSNALDMLEKAYNE